MIYTCHGTCSRSIELEVENGIVKSCSFNGGCSGNTKGISKLVVGMKVDDVIAKLEGTKCGYKETSCPDQLAQALKQMRG